MNIIREQSGPRMQPLVTLGVFVLALGASKHGHLLLRVLQFRALLGNFCYAYATALLAGDAG